MLENEWADHLMGPLRARGPITCSSSCFTYILSHSYRDRQRFPRTKKDLFERIDQNCYWLRVWFHDERHWYSDILQLNADGVKTIWQWICIAPLYQRKIVPRLGRPEHGLDSSLISSPTNPCPRSRSLACLPHFHLFWDCLAHGDTRTLLWHSHKGWLLCSWKTCWPVLPSH